ncbi:MULTISPECIES: DUF1292 domain-containing protein [Pseudothermotoga]|jgi:uncharacterized protein YrzB (UPF0473 family)|uniref:DUF1292 domain-containing protein n=1 Tax=Pseudothermotoga lettingae (strain ATCC BAA-301 / DSM 14385 / NBRC 107922 / TMO) TaxID=416591 RepID=A8F419_PSELT|nr:MULTISPECIES: DUF1292 domain-containing protein [Pseudothermotoga]ABV32903.1 conserved hypothetical protein [Pseudothermotoga lettingae TMO]KUK21808.1 MAG: Uncharacterized protein XD56_0282 [Pseudothermotoga lettingae]MDI3494031.1 hypothetical protein [Pseudothermotoga sp.]MDK2884953.1 hypothetical protein [Pseudothermotoga sp.]GLI48098.1 hypothetical protein PLETTINGATMO_02670 [Pseudothermotoga lettingae TMO]
MEKENFEVFVLTDENNVDHHFVLLAEIENSGKKYWVCEEIMVDEEGQITDFGEIYPFEVKKDDTGNLFVDSIETEEEFDRVSEAWNNMLENDEKLRGMFNFEEHGESEEE